MSAILIFTFSRGWAKIAKMLGFLRHKPILLNLELWIHYGLFRSLCSMRVSLLILPLSR